ncbi:hypothetical protein LINPERPRIM_LOCUS17264 [Linum perenne]
MATQKVVATMIMICLIVATIIHPVKGGSSNIGCRKPCEDDCNKKHDNRNLEFCQMTCSTSCYNKPIIDFFTKLFSSNSK